MADCVQRRPPLRAANCLSPDFGTAVFSGAGWDHRPGPRANARCQRKRPAGGADHATGRLLDSCVRDEVESTTSWPTSAAGDHGLMKGDAPVVARAAASLAGAATSAQPRAAGRGRTATNTPAGLGRSSRGRGPSGRAGRPPVCLRAACPKHRGQKHRRALLTPSPALNRPKISCAGLTLRPTSVHDGRVDTQSRDLDICSGGRGHHVGRADGKHGGRER